MRILYVVDGRSPTARGWIEHFVARGDEVHVVSTVPCDPSAIPGTHLHTAPIGLQLARRRGPRPPRASANRRLHAAGTRVSGILRRLAHYLQDAGAGTLGTHWQGPRVRAIVREVRPDLVHGMRLQFEGSLAAAAAGETPLLLSIWGNDLTLHASGHWLVGRQARRALRRADGLHTDAARDQRLAAAWGFELGKPRAVLPSGGGVRAEHFFPGVASPSLRATWGVPEGATVITYPRGLRPRYVRMQELFAALALVVRARPEVVMLCPGLEHEAFARRCAERLRVDAAVRLLPRLEGREMGELFRLATVSVSPTIHDGTPNTLLEAMACGCFPVAGDLESIREWLTDGENGLLCDPTNVTALAGAILRALGDARLRQQARQRNLALVAERAARGPTMRRAESLYAEVLASAGARRRESSLSHRHPGTDA